MLNDTSAPRDPNAEVSKGRPFVDRSEEAKFKQPTAAVAKSETVQEQARALAYSTGVSFEVVMRLVALERRVAALEKNQ